MKHRRVILPSGGKQAQQKEPVVSSILLFSSFPEGGFGKAALSAMRYMDARRGKK